MLYESSFRNMNTYNIRKRTIVSRRYYGCYCLAFQSILLLHNIVAARRFPKIPIAPYHVDDSEPFTTGWGKEMTLFATDVESRDDENELLSNNNNVGRIRAEQYVRAHTTSTRASQFPFREGNNDSYNTQQQQQQPSLFQPLTDWWSTNITPNVKSWPKIVCRVEPTTTLKLRKTFRPLGTIIRLGAQFNTQLQVWQFKSDWEDAVIGGKLTLAGRELQLTKSWQLSVGAVEDLVTRLRFRAAVDLSTWKAYARVGFRTERLTPINIMEGFTFQQEVPLDGPHGHVKLQVKANFALPEPEIEYSTETQRSLIGMGDIQISVEELNLLLDY